MKKRAYRKKLKVGSEKYKIKFVDRLSNKNNIAECDGDTNTISILETLDEEDTFRAFVHEVLHSFEFTYDIKISHKAIYQLEEAIVEFLLDNKLLKKNSK